MLSGGDVGTIIPQWEPWWCYRKEKKILEEIKEGNEENEHLKLCPDIKTVPKFSSLTVRTIFIHFYYVMSAKEGEVCMSIIIVINKYTPDIINPLPVHY